MWIGVAVLVVALVGCTAPTGPGIGDEGGPGERVEVWSVLPPGNGYPSGRTAANRDDQRPLYENLSGAVERDELTDENLGRYFKRADIDVDPDDVRAIDAPRAGVSVRWDRWGVPYVTGDSTADVAFGAGWATMEGRGIVAELARVVGRRGGQELGTDDILAAVDPERRIDYTDAELEARFTELREHAPDESAALLDDVDEYVAGINQWIGSHPEHNSILALLGFPTERWVRADVVASLLTVITGPSSGGEELANAAAFADMVGALGADEAAAAYHDLRAADGPTATHVETATGYPVFNDGSGPDSPRDPASIASPDDTAQARLATTPSSTKPEHSNVIAVAADRTAVGSPILVGGPQNGLTSPSLLFEMSLSGGGIRSRGVVLPGGGPYVFVGRSDSYAWTSTSGETDQTDTRAELLCEPDGATPTTSSTHYLFNGSCVAFTVPPGATSRTAPRSVHGPVLSTGTVDGAPVAYTVQRASAGSELFAALMVRRLNRNEITGPEEFVAGTADITFTGHWFYADAEHIAYALAGRHPVRRAGVTTEFPSWGTGEWEWQGWMDPSENPSAVDPPSGCLHSWNNKVAPGWNTADDDWGNVGPHRVDLLVDRVCGRDGLQLSDVVAAHTAAGDADLRGAEVLPAVLDVLEASTAPSPRLEAVRQVLDRWASAGAYRRDNNNDLLYDDPAVGIMDELFEPLVRQMFGDQLGGLIETVPLRIDAGARVTSSSFGYGWYGMVERDLRRVGGDDTTGARLPVACGSGVLVQCQDRLWDAIRTAAYPVEAAQFPWMRDTPSQWSTTTLRRGRMTFLPIVFNPVSMRWSNRPAYELAVQFRP